MRRMSARGRGEEGAVTFEYLSNLHSKHEEWLHSGMLRPDHLELLSDPSKNRVCNLCWLPSDDVQSNLQLRCDWDSECMVCANDS